MFHAYNCSLQIDNVYIYGSVPSNWGPYNHVINSSFEFATNPDIPDVTTEINQPNIGGEWRSETDYSQWHDNWKYDDTIAWDGSMSMRIYDGFLLQGHTRG